jgi:hypothetical protein
MLPESSTRKISLVFSVACPFTPLGRNAYKSHQLIGYNVPVGILMKGA